jgi:hypothetical protein
MTGYNFDDIVAFMISPISEFIDSMSMSNMFQDSDLENTAQKAINLARGIVKSSDFLHGTLSIKYTNEETGSTDSKNLSKIKYVMDDLLSSDYS